MKIWLRHSPSVRGKEDWRFIHVYTHGITASKSLFDEAGLKRMTSDLMKASGVYGFKVHFVTAREAYNIIRAAEAGLSGDPEEYRNFEVGVPTNRLINVENSPYAEAID